VDSPEIHLEHVSLFNAHQMKFSQMEIVFVSQDFKETHKVFVLKSVDQMNSYQIVNVYVYQDLSETHSVFVFQSHVEIIKFSSTTYVNVDKDLFEHQLELVLLPHHVESTKSMINLVNHVSADKVTDLIHQQDSVQSAHQTQVQVDYYQVVFVIPDTLGVQPYKDV
jgi:hypothetical protein